MYKRELELITFTIDKCDYVYNVKKNNFISYWCDCPIEFPKKLMKHLENLTTKINNEIEKGEIKLD